MRSKDIRSYSEEMESTLGTEVFKEGDPVDLAESSEYDLLFVSGRILGLIHDGRAFVTVRGALEYSPKKRHVTVDMGAVPFVTKGADIMAPGIVDADPDIVPGQLVWIRDQRNNVPLAVGESILSGPEMTSSTTGKAIINIHHVGDKLWKFEEP